MAEMKTYTGGCHCGKVRYEVKLELGEVNSCNCSLCSKAGWLLTFVPAEQFKLLSGADGVTDYQFARKHIHHVFCPSCGVRSFSHAPGSDGGEVRAINVRCLDDVDLSSLKVKLVDGKKF